MCIQYKYLTLNNEKCRDKEYCVYSTDDNICKMLFPKVNLINGSDNESQYFTRLSNELIKFDRIKTFIFKPRSFLSFKEITYSLNDDEIILLEDILYGDYFIDLVPETKNKFISMNATWNTTEPIKTQKYVNSFNMDVLSKDTSINPCVITSKESKKLSFGSLSDKELSDYKLIEYKNSINCTWELFKEILNLHTKQKYSIQDIINQLIQLYDGLVENNLEKIPSLSLTGLYPEGGFPSSVFISTSSI